MRSLIFAGLLGLCAGVPALAEDRVTLGFGRLMSNDFFWDTQDRWRTASYNFSIVRGPEWSGARPEGFGEIIEFRLRNEMIMPGGRRADGQFDRPYVGMWTAGVHTHYATDGMDVSLGVDLVAMGPSTRVSDLQQWYHELVSFPDVIGIDEQLDDALHLSGTIELGWPTRLSQTVTVRPFFEGQTGVEEILRVGVDVLIGATGQNDLLIRDVVTGQLIRAIETDFRGYNVTLGADWAHVGGSVFLPADLGYAHEDSRWRVRAGVNVQVTSAVSLFYGATYLSEEFVGQPEGQVVAGLKLNFNF